MTNEERDIITQFIARVGGAQAGPQAWGGSVPATTSPALPPVDREADALIGDLFNRYPESRYRLTQLAFIQEHALTEAQNRIKRLEWDVQQAQQVAQQAAQQAQQQPQSGGGFFGGLFGGGRSAPPPQQPGPAWNQAAPQPNYQQAAPPPNYQQAPPPPQYAPGYQPGMFQRSGSGFLGSALTTAAGVAGGLVVGNALMDMFSPNRGAGGLLGGGGGGFAPAAPAAESPWGSAAATPQIDQGTWTPDPGSAAAAPDQGYVDQGTWDQPSNNDPSWADNSTDPGTDSSFDNSNNNTDDTF